MRLAEREHKRARALKLFSEGFSTAVVRERLGLPKCLASTWRTEAMKILKEEGDGQFGTSK